MLIRAFAAGFVGFGSAILAVEKFGGYSLHRVDGPSMRPTFNPEETTSRDIVLVKRIRDPELVKELAFGTILCVDHPKKPGYLLIKRLKDKSGLPADHCWIESDSGPNKYLDSSFLGPIPHDKVTGVATRIVYPFGRAKAL